MVESASTLIGAAYLGLAILIVGFIYGWAFREMSEIAGDISRLQSGIDGLEATLERAAAGGRQIEGQLEPAALEADPKRVE